MKRVQGGECQQLWNETGAQQFPVEHSALGDAATSARARIYLESGRLPEAIASLSEAHSLHLASGDLMGQAAALKYLGQAQHGVGQADQARESLQAALALIVDLDATAEVENIQAALAALAQPCPRSSLAS